MSNRNRTSIKYSALMATLFAVLLLVGCSQSPVAPTTQTTDTSEPHVLSRSTAFGVGASLSPVPYHTEAVINAATGGRLELVDVVLDIPAGALDVDTTYSIDIPDLTVFYNEFGTDGLVFNVPVTVTMSYRGADLSGVDESTIRIGWWDEDGQKWVDMVCTIDKVNQTVTGQLHHFSAYALVSD